MKTRITPIKNNVFDSCNFCGSRDHPFELRSDRALVICICHQCLTSIIAQFNKPPVYGQIEFSKLKYQIGEILIRKFLEYNDGKFHTALEFNPATHELAEFVAGLLPPSPGSVEEFNFDPNGEDKNILDTQISQTHSKGSVDVEEKLDAEAERFFNLNYSGTATSDFLKPYIINTFKMARQSVKEVSRDGKPSTQGGEECGYYTKNGSTFYGPLKAEIERLNQENERFIKAYNGIKANRDELDIRIQVLEEALKEWLNYGDSTVQRERTIKALNPKD